MELVTTPKFLDEDVELLQSAEPRKFDNLNMNQNAQSTVREKICHEDWSLDVDYTINYTKWLLSLLGVWPIVSFGATKTELYFSKLLIIVVCLLMFFLTVPCLAHMLLREKDPLTRVMMMGPIGFYIANILKYISLFYRRGLLKESMSHLVADWRNIGNFEDRETMRRNARVGRNFTAISCSILYPSTTFYHLIMPLSSGKSTNEFNETTRKLVLRGFDMLIDDQKSPTYELILYTGFVASLINSTISITSCNLAAVLVSHACGQFGVISSRLQTLVDSAKETKEYDVKEKIKWIVRTHVRVLRFSGKIEKILREICFIEVIASTLTICLDEYYCMKEWKNSDALAILTYVGALISFSFNIFIFCDIGEQLKEQFVQIERAAYMSEWYKLPGKTGLPIVMIIGTSNYPVKLTAGRMMELSIRNFGFIMKNTLAYLNMIRATGY